MARNPFHYGTPVGPEHFAGRSEERTALVARLRDGINVVVVSPRRFGKTSLLLRAEEDLAGEAALIHVNVLRCRDAADLVGRLAGAAFGSRGGRWHRARSAVAEFAQRLRVAPNVSFAPDGTPRFGFAGDLASPDVDALIADVYALLADQVDRRPAALVLDEFQAITDHGTHLPGLLKALADEHHGVALVLAGSRSHLMERLTGSSGAPLYGMAERLALGPIDGAAMRTYLMDRSVAGGRPMDEDVADAVATLAGPVPNDIQRLAYGAHEAAPGPITVADVEVAMRLAVEHDAATFADLFGRLAPGQRRVLLAFAQGEVAEPYSAGFARSVRLATGASVRRAIDGLAADDTLIRRGDRWFVADPFLRSWLCEVGEG